ncbi:hypothetical protein [Nocardiopsis sp. FR26]|uniref:hypothetical protein n=1 Tax=Nocardiopsis sp. FR26 TaxID=2605987 RepID=UPI00135C162C|nr:hypothetical protein [Nocardiopsis sp. FR26]
MAAYTHRTVHTITEEWEVPAGPSGVPIGEFSRALTAASRVYRDTHGLDHYTALPDDALWVAGREDGSVVISFQARTTNTLD